MPAAPQPVTLDDGCPECVPARGRGACGEIPHEIWRRTIPYEGPRPWFELGAAVQGRTLSAYIAEMCGRFTRNYTWEQIQALYRLTAPAAIPNLQPRFNACPTDPADTIVERESKRELVEMRWGLVPFWWSKPFKELRLATFNARVETVTTKPFFREPFKSKRCLMPVSGYYEWQDTPEGKQPRYFTARDGSPVLTIAGLWMNGRTAKRVSA